MPFGVIDNTAASEAEESRFDSWKGSLQTNWDKKPTELLEIILGSLKRLEPNLKKSREKTATLSKIMQIEEILKQRKNK